jgi:hypothetical protein
VHADGEALAHFMTAAKRDAGSGSTTEIALASAGAAITISLTLRNAAGADVASGAARITLAANAQTTRTLEQLFPNAATDRFDGTLEVSVESGAVSASAFVTVANGSGWPMPIVPMP